MPTPNIALRRLAAELTRLRREARMTHDDVHNAIRLSRNSVSRAENAIGRPHYRTLVALLDLYGASDSDRSAIIELHKAAGAGLPGWLARYNDALPGEYPAYIQFEAEATKISVWNGQAVPGLLQTPDYARAIVENGTRDLTEQEVSNRVEARLTRQTILHRTDGPTYTAIIDEVALRRPVGGRKVVKAQLDYLAKASHWERVTILAIPESVGAHAGLSGPFTVLEFKTMPPVVYLEHVSGDVFLDDKEDVKAFQATIERLRKTALGPEESRQMIEQLANG